MNGLSGPWTTIVSNSYVLVRGRSGHRNDQDLLHANALTLLALLSLLIILSACAKPEEEIILAGIDELRVTDEQYFIALKNYYRDTGQAINLSRGVKAAVLNNLLDRYAGVTFARDQGWATDHEALFRRDIIERKVLVEEYQRRMIYDEVYITEEDLRELFLRLHTEIRASHLYAPSREKADSLFRLVENSADFGELAGQIFRSAHLIRNGGDLGYFTVDEMDIAFEDMAFQLEPGEISAPVRTSTGFSIIKVTDRRTRPMITEYEYANARGRIYPLAVDQKKELATRVDIDEKIALFNIPEDLLRQLWEGVQQVSRESSIGYVDFRPLPSSHAGLGSHTLADLEHFVFTVDDFLDEAFYTLPEDWQEIERFHQFRDFVEGVIYRTYAIRAIQQSDRIDRDFVEGAINETFYSYLYTRFDDYVKQSVEVTADELRREYDENRAYYVSPVALNLREMGVATLSDAEAAMEMLEGGAGFMSVFERFAIDDALKGLDGELGFIDIDRLGTLSVPLADIQPGEVKGPFQLQENRILIFKCVERKEERSLTFSEAESAAREYLQHVKKEAVRGKLLAQVKEKHGAFVNLDEVDQLTLEF